MKATASLKRGLARIRRLRRDGDHAAALAEVDQLLARWPDLPPLLVTRAELIQLLDENAPPLEEARGNLERATELDEESLSAWLELGHFLDAVQGEPEEAERCFERAASLARQRLEEALLARARVLGEQGRDAEALSCLLEVHALPPAQNRPTMNPRLEAILAQIRALAHSG